jgi:dihydroorotase
MAEVGMPLLCHGETTDPAADMFDREALWVSSVLKPLVQGVPELKVVMEHCTTAEGVEFVMNAREGVAATITVQHLLLNRNALFSYKGQVWFPLRQLHSKEKSPAC